MSAAIALIFLAEAATSCASDRGEMPGGATIVRPVGTSDPVPFEPLGPAPAMSKPDVIQQVSAADDAGDPGDGPAPAQCEVVSVQIV